MTQAQIQPIKTLYSGHMFRSKLEAKWAVFFDEMGLIWHYEPEAFAVGSGWYTPDFYLPEAYVYEHSNVGLYIEIKPLGWNSDSLYISKISRSMRRENLAILCGEPYDFAIPHWNSAAEGFLMCPDFAKHQTLAHCEECCTVGLTYNGVSTCKNCDGTTRSTRLLDAATTARQHKFYHKH